MNQIFSDRIRRCRLSGHYRFYVVGVLVLMLFAFQFSATQVSAAAPPTISGITLSSNTIAAYDKLEITVAATTSATNLNLPYDAAPPAGVAAGIGVSIDALFSLNNWQTTITQPAFLYQSYTFTAVDGKDHFIPNGAPTWKVRFTPQQAGTWLFRLRITDAGGTTYYPSATTSLSFTASGATTNQYKRHGFLRVSQADKRYFEFQDGTPFIGVGYNDSLGNVPTAESKFTRFENGKMNLMRVWLSSAAINGSQWYSWAYPNYGVDGYLPQTNFDTSVTYGGSDVSMRLDSTAPCYFADWTQGSIPVEPNTTYQVSARVKLNNVTGSGFVVKQAGFVQSTCTQSSVGAHITTPINGTVDWTTVTGSFTTAAGQNWMDYLWLALEGSGTAYVDNVQMWKASDPTHASLLRHPSANSHMTFDPMNSARWDKIIESAENHGVYLKLVIDEKSEWIRNHISSTGAMTGTGSNDNFYASPKSRWLEQAWWRYILARWGYSPAIHSLEYVNEGDPYDGNHYDGANALAHYIHQNDANRHMVTTSTWAAFPNKEFWSTSEVDYADIHVYINPGDNLSFLDSTLADTTNIHSGKASAHILGTNHVNTPITPRGVVMRGKGEWLVRYWMKANNFTATCNYGSTGGQQRVRYRVDGGAYWGGQEGIVPNTSNGQDFICTSPGGTYNWQQFNSTQDRNGALLPTQYRIILNDDLPHEIILSLENPSGTGGEVWIDDVEIVSPTGQVIPVVGQFDQTSIYDDTALSNNNYGILWNGNSAVGARKPLMRGETGLQINYQPDLTVNQDTKGVWLHNELWSQVGYGAMIDLNWWPDQIIPTSLDYNFTTFRNFMSDQPVNNGNYKDALASTNNPSLRAWGQRDDVNGRIALWAQNTQHTWTRVVHGPAIPSITGNITLPNVPSGKYQISWWNTYQVSNPIFLTQNVTHPGGTLTLSLPAALGDDVGIKVYRTGSSGLPPSNHVFLPLIKR